MWAIKRIFQVIAGLWLLAAITMGLGSAWVQNNPETAVNAAASVTGLDEFAEPRLSEAQRERLREQRRAAERAAENGWGAGQSLPAGASSQSRGWAE